MLYTTSTSNHIIDTYQRFSTKIYITTLFIIVKYSFYNRGIHHHISVPHIETLLNEFCFKLNRSQRKEMLFHSDIRKVTECLPLLRKNIPTKRDFILL